MICWKYFGFIWRCYLEVLLLYFLWKRKGTFTKGKINWNSHFSIFNLDLLNDLALFRPICFFQSTFFKLKNDCWYSRCNNCHRLRWKILPKFHKIIQKWYFKPIHIIFIFFQDDTSSVISFTSSIHSLNDASMTHRRREDIDAKIEFGNSLMELFGSNDADKLSRTFLAMSSSPANCDNVRLFD